MTTDEIIEYYQGLLIAQYEALPNATATTAAFVSQVIANQIEDQVRNGFDFSTVIGLAPGDAVGPQLESIASYRGLQRLVYGLDLTRTYFEMPVYGQTDADTRPGFALYGQSPITWYFLNYIDTNRPIYAMTDDQLCRVTQFRAQADSNLLSVAFVDQLLENFFGNNAAVFEDGAMHITYIDLISDPDPLFGICAATNSLPRPAGVRADVIRSETISEFFGFQNYSEAINPTFVGFGLYGSPQSGSFVRYP